MKKKIEFYDFQIKFEMAIATATQKGSSVYVYNEKGSLLFSKSGELQGYTSSTVSIRRGSTVYTYDEKGILKFQK